ncbi:Metalloenzyme, LuxS/M16 peptidase-like protein [Amanita muscaria]
MLTAAARNVQRIARNYATVVDSAGVRVASIDHGHPTSTVTVFVKAGSRFQPAAGVAHALKNFAFKSTAKRSALGTVRESELYGGQLSATLGREYLALTAEFLRGDEDVFVDILGSFIKSAKFTRHEYEEYVQPIISQEVEAAASDPTTRAIEIAHSLAFRSGLGSPLLAPAHHSITAEDVKSFAETAFTKGSVAVLGAGIESSILAKLTEKSFAFKSSSVLTSAASKYYGGESRAENFTGPQTLFVGFGATGAHSPDIATLAAHLSPTPSIKWSKGLSAIGTSIPQDSSVQAVYLPYSDASLVGLLIQGVTTAAVKEAGKAAVQALQGAASGIKEEDFKRAVAKAKFNAAQAIDTKYGIITALGTQIFGGPETSLEATLASLDGITASSVSKAASTLLKGKPTFVAVGAIDSLPYADELGL